MKVIKTILLIILVLVVVLVCFGVFNLFKAGKASQEVVPQLGVVDGQLLACPSSPNCVNSYESDEVHGIASLKGDVDDFNALVAHLAELEAVTIELIKEDYAWVTYKSSLFGFIDDLELYLDDSEIQVRSASREGYGDLGVNRERVENLRSFLASR